MKILFLTDNFPPEVNAPANRTFEHCREWVKHGGEVTVVTCFPNFPGGKIYDGFRHKLFQRENIEGINVIRVWTYVSPNKGIVRRSLDYLSFGIASFIVGLFSSCNLIVATSPQFFTAVSAGAISVLRRKKFVFEVRDLWPESIIGVDVMKKNIVIHILSWIEKLLYQRAWRIIVVSEAFTDSIVARGVNRNKIHCISNGIDRNVFSPQKRNEVLVEKLKLENKFIVGYMGTHGMAHKLDFIINSISNINDNSLHFIFIGEGAKKEKLVMQAEKLELKNITFINNVSRDEVPAYLSLLDIGLINLRKSEAFEKVIPSKLFELAAMEIPVLLGVQGEAQKLLMKYNAGTCFEPENKDDFISKLMDLKNNSRLREEVKAGAALLAKDFNRKMLAQKMFELLRSK
ncbi:MAG TPA: glycosyltransferase family 4 protein [Bacteroidia bacterium]|nr:glycosyltransferase family 4 protein [Bacteroidia bacterium]